MAKNAQAGPSRNRSTQRNSEVIDLTLDDSDSDEDISLPPFIRKLPAPRRQSVTSRTINASSSIISMTREEQYRQEETRRERRKERKYEEQRKVDKGKEVDRGRPPVNGSKRPDDQKKVDEEDREATGIALGVERRRDERKDDQSKADKGKGVDKGRTSIPGGSNQIQRNMTASGSTRPDIAPNRPPQGSMAPVNKLKRSHTTAQPPQGHPTIHDRLMNRNVIPAASTAPLSNKKPGRGKDLVLSTSPQRQARPSAGSSTAALHNVDELQTKTSRINALFFKYSTKPLAAAAASGSNRPNVTQGSQKPVKPMPITNPLARTISKESNTSTEIFANRPKSQSSSVLVPTSLGRSVSPIKANTMDKGGLVPGPREKGKQKQVIPEERGRPVQPVEDVRGIKRDRSAAFGASGEPERKPGQKVGRQRDLDSSVEMKRKFSPGKVIGSPREGPGPIGRSLQRTDSLGRATPTPAARPLPPVFGSGHVRQASPLKESTSSRNLASRQPVPTQSTRAERISTPPHTSASPAKVHPSTLKQTSLVYSPGNTAARTETSLQYQKRPQSSPNKHTHKPLIDETTKDPSYKTHRRRKIHPEDDEEEEKEEEDIPSRPKRARPAAGAYAVPSMENPDWPTQNGTMSNGAPRKRRRKSMARQANAESGFSPDQQIPKSTINNSDARSVISFRSTSQSESPEKRDQAHIHSSNKTLRLLPSTSTTVPDRTPKAGSGKIPPSTPRSRHRRLSSHALRTTSKQSLHSHSSLVKSPSHRDRPPTIAPQTPDDDLDEEPEPIENRPPTPAQTSEPAEDDPVRRVSSYIHRD